MYPSSQLEQSLYRHALLMGAYWDHMQNVVHCKCKVSGLQKQYIGKTFGVPIRSLHVAILG